MMKALQMIGLPAVIAGLWIGTLTHSAAAQASDTKGSPMEQEIAKTLNADDTIVVFETTAGNMVLRFFPDDAPKHVESFVKLSKDGFYDGTKFHRVIKGFMIQGGDPNTKDGDPRTWGTGGPGYQLKAEFNDRKHVKGILSMARSMDPDSAGSQFFVMHGTAPHLDKQYTVFGQLVSGYDVLDKIANAEVKPSPNNPREVSSPAEPVEVKKAHVTTWAGYQKSEAEGEPDTDSSESSESSN